MFQTELLKFYSEMINYMLKLISTTIDRFTLIQKLQELFIGY